MLNLLDESVKIALDDGIRQHEVNWKSASTDIILHL